MESLVGALRSLQPSTNCRRLRRRPELYFWEEAFEWFRGDLGPLSIEKSRRLPGRKHVDPTKAMLQLTSRDCLRGVDSENEKAYTFQGVVEYWHYGCQGVDDRGWGCGYRTLQSLMSWFKLNLSLQSTFPDIQDIQTSLVKIGDKPASFLHSHDWIGSVEVGLVLQDFTNTDYRLIHVPDGAFLEEHLAKIRQQFTSSGAPIMMGGSEDCSSKCIVALKEALDSKSASLLILNPHYYSEKEEPTSLQFLWDEGWLKWQKIEDLLETDFYNMCMPLAAYA